MPRKKKTETVAKDADPGYVASLEDPEPELSETTVTDSEGVAEKVKEPEIELVEELIRYDFTDVELLKLAESLDDKIHKINRVEEEKKSAVDKFKAEISRLELDRNAILTAFHDKFEMRRVDCYLIRDYKERKAYYLRVDRYPDLEFLKTQAAHIGRATDDGAIQPVKVRDLKSWELQRELPFGEGEPDAEV